MCCSSSSLLIIPFQLRRLRRGRWVTAGHGRQRLRDRHLDRWIRLLGRWSFWEMPFFWKVFVFPSFFNPWLPWLFFYPFCLFYFWKGPWNKGEAKVGSPKGVLEDMFGFYWVFINTCHYWGHWSTRVFCDDVPTWLQDGSIWGHRGADAPLLEDLVEGWIIPTRNQEQKIAKIESPKAPTWITCFASWCIVFTIPSWWAWVLI